MNLKRNDNDAHTRKEISITKRIVSITSLLILALLIWQTLSTSADHKEYQDSLMDSVTDRVVSDYQEYFNQLRLEIDLFQERHYDEINQLALLANEATEQDYSPLHNKFQNALPNSRLFAFIEKNGQGSLAHITGDFLTQCKEEIHSTIASGFQQRLFLHHTDTNVHFDLLQPLVQENSRGKYFFAAFGTKILQEILSKYQLPYQQIFVLRKDDKGFIELSTLQDDFSEGKIPLEEIENFSFVKPIQNTRWQIAIRLDPEFRKNFFVWGILKALFIWLILSSLIYIFYRSQKRKLVEQSEINRELIYKDKYDKLTGLANRKNFENTLAEEISNRVDTTSNFGVIYHIDIDKFQLINSSFGYAVGDRLLLQLAMAMRKFIPENALLSRLSSDEFAIYLPKLEHKDAKDFGHNIRKLVKHTHIEEDNKEIHLTASVGAIALDGAQFDMEQVLSSLSLCIKLAKNKGGNRVILYQGDDPKLNQHSEEMEAIHILSRALKNNQLVLYRQEIKSLQANDEVKHYEVLVRIKTADGKIIYPNDFIPAAEKYGLIKQLDRCVISMVLDGVVQLDDSSTYSINLSGASLADRDIIEFALEAFEKSPVNPNRICFEITETYAISHLNSALLFMEKMIALGCTFSLDDFGSGLSSFSYLQKLPVSILKIDGIFVRDMDVNKVNRIFVENIQRSANAMNIKTVAEFIETADIETTLAEIGIDYGQGYQIHKPEPWFSYDN